jgi:ubiquinone/menaquinone biosynthesis C-methylase UbiE
MDTGRTPGRADFIPRKANQWCTMPHFQYHDEEERRSWQDPDTILADIGLGDGLVVIDVGCGQGFFALPAARRVGNRGRVFGIDTNPEAVAMMMERAGSEGLHTIQGFVGTGEETVVCEGCADVVFFGIDLHDFSDTGKVLANARRMMKTGGRLVDLDWKKEETPFGPPQHIRFSEAEAAALIEDAGFSVIEVRNIPPWFYRITAVPR